MYVELKNINKTYGDYKACMQIPCGRRLMRNGLELQP